jgi:hypothetical protein
MNRDLWGGRRENMWVAAISGSAETWSLDDLSSLFDRSKYRHFLSLFVLFLSQQAFPFKCLLVLVNLIPLFVHLHISLPYYIPILIYLFSSDLWSFIYLLTYTTITNRLNCRSYYKYRKQALTYPNCTMCTHTEAVSTNSINGFHSVVKT